MQQYTRGADQFNSFPFKSRRSPKVDTDGIQSDKYIGNQNVQMPILMKLKAFIIGRHKTKGFREQNIWRKLIPTETMRKFKESLMRP